MESFKEFVKKEFVVIVSGAAALISCLFVPAAKYIDYVDTDVLATLLSLMLIIAGLKGNGVLFSFSICNKYKTCTACGFNDDIFPFNARYKRCCTYRISPSDSAFL